MRSGMRLGAALLSASVALMLSALPASADQVAGKLSGTNIDGLKVGLKNGKFGTHLFGLTLADGSSLSAYCINIKTKVNYEKPDMTEVPWDSYPDASSSFGENRANINWLLHNSFPFVGLQALQQKLSLPDLTAEEAIAATQAAAWHFSDDTDIDTKNPTPDKPDSKADVLALYQYLTGDKNVGLANLPEPKLDVTPKTLSGQAGKPIGPFMISTTASIAKLTPHVPDGVKLTDKDGKELTAGHLVNGSEVFVNVPESAAAGKGSFELKASGEAGRVFVAKEKEATQNLIVAQAEMTKLSTSGEANWTAATHPVTPPAPQASNGGGLADTGVSIYVPLGLGVLLLAAGAGALLFLRRRGRA